mgnify:CR=1 FL=1
MSTQEIERKIRLLREMQRMAEEAQTEADALKDEIKAYMGDSEELYAGEYKVTWKPVESSRIDTAALKKALPELAAASASHEKSPLPERRPKQQAKSL